MQPRIPPLWRGFHPKVVNRQYGVLQTAENDGTNCLK